MLSKRTWNDKIEKARESRRQTGCFLFFFLIKSTRAEQLGAKKCLFTIKSSWVSKKEKKYKAAGDFKTE